MYRSITSEQGCQQSEHSRLASNIKNKLRYTFLLNLYYALLVSGLESSPLYMYLLYSMQERYRHFFMPVSSSLVHVVLTVIIMDICKTEKILFLYGSPKENSECSKVSMGSCLVFKHPLEVFQHI